MPITEPQGPGSGSAPSGEKSPTQGNVDDQKVRDLARVPRDTGTNTEKSGPDNTPKK